MGALVVLALCAWLPRGALAVHPAASSATLTSAQVRSAKGAASGSGATFASVSFADSQAQAD